jgi:hypothetical protein
MSTVRCFACGEMGHYAGQCPKKKKKKQQDGSAATAEEMEFSDQFARECAFIATLSTITPSSISWGDRVDEDRLTHNSDSEGDQIQCPWTDSEWVTGPPSIATVSEQPSRQVLRFGYLGKWSPCAYESLSTKGEDYYPCTLLYDSNFTLT